MLLALLLLAASPDPLPALQARVAQALPAGPLRQQFKAITAGWRKAMAVCGAQAACKAGVTERQSHYLAALAARTSDDNPTLGDLKAAALVGRWRVGEPRNLDTSRKGHLLEDGIPPPGSIVEGRPGTICTPDCHDAGLEPGTLGDGAADGQIRSALKLPAAAPAWTVMLDGKAGYRLLSAGDTLLIAATSCDQGARNCWPTLIPLLPLEKAALVDLKPS